MSYRVAYTALLHLDLRCDCWQDQLRNGDIRFLGQGVYDDPQAGAPQWHATGKLHARDDDNADISNDSAGLHEDSDIPMDKPFGGPALHGANAKKNCPSESRHTILWIWTVASVSEGADGEDLGLNDALRVEWAKSHARCQRWEEEVVLLQEEMQRVGAYLEWKEKWWISKCTQRTGLETELVERITAYATKQAALQQALCLQFLAMWMPTVTWATEQLRLGDNDRNFAPERDHPGHKCTMIESDEDKQSEFVWSD